mgnify:CR=1 FL=1
MQGQHFKRDFYHNAEDLRVGSYITGGIVVRSITVELAGEFVPGVIFDAAAKGAQAYIAFGKELVERIG